jgi:hypothetical protein
MKIYYLNEALNEEELESIKEFLAEREGTKYIEVIDQIRIPTVLPTLDIDGYFRDDVRKLIDLVKKNLHKTGLLRDSGGQIVFVLGKDNFWNGIFQLAISEVTGFYPYIFNADIIMAINA